MTPKKCKELLDTGILQAYAEGKEIQFLHSNKGWVSCPDSPYWEDNVLYRIKPEKKTGWINLYGDCQMKSGHHFTVYPTKEIADHAAGESRIACIQIEYSEGEGL